MTAIVAITTPRMKSKGARFTSPGIALPVGYAVVSFTESTLESNVLTRANPMMTVIRTPTRAPTICAGENPFWSDRSLWNHRPFSIRFSSFSFTVSDRIYPATDPMARRVSLYEHIELWVPIVKVFDPLYTDFRKSLSHGYSVWLYIHTHRFDVCTEKAQRHVPPTESLPSHRARFLEGVTFRTYVHFYTLDKLVVANATTYRHEVANATCCSERYNIIHKLVVAKNTSTHPTGTYLDPDAHAPTMAPRKSISPITKERLGVSNADTKSVTLS